MAVVALVGLVRGMADLIEAALSSEDYTVSRLPLDADIIRALARTTPDVVVVDGHAYANTRALLTDLRAQPATASLPVVLLGPARPAEVPHFEVVQRLGRSFDVDEFLTAIRRVQGTPYPG